MFDINEVGRVFKIHAYKIERKDTKNIYINVFEQISPENEYPFIAVPVKLFLDRHSFDKFWIGGKTELKALKGCLEKIKDLDDDAIFPPIGT